MRRFNPFLMGDMVDPPIHVTIGAAVSKAQVLSLQQALQQIARHTGNPKFAFTLAPKWADGAFGPSTANAVNLIIRQAKRLPPATAAALKPHTVNLTKDAVQILQQLKSTTRPAAVPRPQAAKPPVTRPAAKPPAARPTARPTTTVTPITKKTPLKSDVVTMQKVVQAIAKQSKRPNLAFTLPVKWADGIVGPSTAKAVNLILSMTVMSGAAVNYSVDYVKANVLPLTERLLGIFKRMQASQKPVTSPAAKKEQLKAASIVQKNDEKVLAATKVTSGIIPITSDSYLQFFPGNPSKNLAPSYKVFKKAPGKKPQAAGSILVLTNAAKLKITGPFAKGTAIEMRSRIPKPWNTYSIVLNGKTVAGRSSGAQPPPVSPHVPPEAPPDATSADYATPRTPGAVQKDIASKQPPSTNAPSLPPDPHSAEPYTKVDPVTGKKTLVMPPMTITADVPLESAAILPDVPESEEILEEFFQQELIAGIAGAMRKRARRRARMGAAPSQPSSQIFDLRFRNLGPLAFNQNPYGATVMPKDIEIGASFDSLDDADEELAEMRASGFSKGWW